MDVTYPGFGDLNATEPASFRKGGRGSGLINSHSNYAI